MGHGIFRVQKPKGSVSLILHYSVVISVVGCWNEIETDYMDINNNGQCLDTEHKRYIDIDTYFVEHKSKDQWNVKHPFEILNNLIMHAINTISTLLFKQFVRLPSTLTEAVRNMIFWHSQRIPNISNTELNYQISLKFLFKVKPNETLSFPCILDFSSSSSLLVHL